MKRKLHFYLLIPVFFAMKAHSQFVPDAPLKPFIQTIRPYHLPSVDDAIKKINSLQIISKQPGKTDVTSHFEVANANGQCALLNKINPSLNLQGDRVATTLVNLKWEARQLYNKKGFDVQRSVGDTNNFKTVAFVAAYKKKQPKEEYKLPDLNQNIRTTYYRLKQIKLDSGYAYSNIIMIKGIPQFNLFPNPVADVLYIKLQTVETSNADIMICDNKGVLVLKQSTGLIKDAVNIKSINVGSLAAGMYSVKLLNADTTIYTGKFIKQ